MGLLAFSHPWFLLLLPTVPFLGWFWWRRPREALPFSDIQLFSSVGKTSFPWIRWFGLLARCGLVGLIILALAGPRWRDSHSRIPFEAIGIQLVADISGSMAEKDV